MSKTFNKFVALTKVDEATRTVYGIATAESVDKVGEVCDYASSKPFYEKWSSGFEKQTGGKSLGNLREMHGNHAAGKLVAINFNDVEKQIEIVGKVVDDSSWAKVMEGVLTGFSQGGRYVKTWEKNGHTYYTADPSEVSLVDNPCLAGAEFQLVRADGAVEMRKFKTVEENKAALKLNERFAGVTQPVQKWTAKDGSTFDSKAEAFQHNAELDASDTPLGKQLAALQAVVAEKEAALGKEGENEDDTKQLDEKKEAQKAAVAKIAELVKGGEVWDVRNALDALIELECVLSCETWEGMMDGEVDGEQIANLKEAILRIKAFIASEIMETDEDKLAMAISAADITKLLADEGVTVTEEQAAKVAKAGARHSKTDASHIAKMSDHMAAIHKEMGGMEECMKGLGAKDDDEDAANKVAKTTEAELQKMLDETTGRIAKAQATQLEELTKRIKLLESQPAEPKGALFAVKKGHETGGETPEVTKSYKAKSSERLTPAERAAEFAV